MGCGLNAIWVKSPVIKSMIYNSTPSTLVEFYVIFDREVDARHFHIIHINLSCLMTSQFAFKDDFFEIWKMGTEGLI